MRQNKMLTTTLATIKILIGDALTVLKSLPDKHVQCLVWNLRIKVADPACKTITVGSLFSGIGGFELGMQMAGGFDFKWQFCLRDCSHPPLCAKIIQRMTIVPRIGGKNNERK